MLKHHCGSAPDILRRGPCGFPVLRYISMGVAADCKELCKGVVLVNSAGKRWHVPTSTKLL